MINLSPRCYFFLLPCLHCHCVFIHHVSLTPLPPPPPPPRVPPQQILSSLCLITRGFMANCPRFAILLYLILTSSSKSSRFQGQFQDSFKMWPRSRQRRGAHRESENGTKNQRSIGNWLWLRWYQMKSSFAQDSGNHFALITYFA